MLYFLTRGVGCKEASSVDTAVRAELDVKLIAGRVDGAGQFTPTQLGQLWSTAAVAIIYLNTQVSSVSFTETIHKKPGSGRGSHVLGVRGQRGKRRHKTRYGRKSQSLTVQE